MINKQLELIQTEEITPLLETLGIKLKRKVISKEEIACIIQRRLYILALDSLDFDADYKSVMDKVAIDPTAMRYASMRLDMEASYILKELMNDENASRSLN